jgi:hypothetical protein
MIAVRNEEWEANALHFQLCNKSSPAGCAGSGGDVSMRASSSLPSSTPSRRACTCTACSCCCRSLPSSLLSLPSTCGLHHVSLSAKCA